MNDSFNFMIVNTEISALYKCVAQNNADIFRAFPETLGNSVLVLSQKSLGFFWKFKSATQRET